MKFFRLDLLTLLISLFIFNSCKNQDTIGLGIVSANQAGNFIDTSTIVVSTVPEDSVVVNALTNSPLAYFKDPVFGVTEASLAIDLNLPNSAAYTLPSGTTVVDSALLVLRYASNSFYGDSLASKYKANVYQLKDGQRVLSSQTYYNSNTWTFEPALLGSKSFLANTSDSLSITTPIAGGKDTVVKVPPQLRIPISTAFINSILYKAPAVQLSSNLVFKNAVRGLYVALDTTQNGIGGTFMFNLDSAAAVQVYYKTTNGSVIDTGVLVLPSTIHAAQIKHHASAAIKAATQSTANSKTFYIQGLGGLRTKISFPYLKNIAKTVGSDVVLNRAELVVTAMPGTNTPFAPLPQLAIYKNDIAGQRQYVQDATNDPRSFGGALGGTYDTQTQQYHFLITAFIQDLMRGVSPDYGTFIGAVVPGTASSIAPTAEVGGRTVAVGFDTSSPLRIKLNLFYTKIAK